MPLPKRIYLENYPYFLTTDTFQRIPVFGITKCCQLLLRYIDAYREKYKFKIIGYNILPCHWHNIILPKKSVDISDMMRDIKSYTQKIVFEYLKKNKGIFKFKFTCGIDCRCQLFEASRGTETAATRRGTSPSRVEQVSVPAWSEAGYKEYGDKDILNLLKTGRLWQKGFYDHIIRNEQDLNEKLDYVNNNAVKHGLASDPVDYKYSSARSYYLGDNSLIKIDEIDL